jgi:hypothetical protein
MACTISVTRLTVCSRNLCHEASGSTFPWAISLRGSLGLLRYVLKPSPLTAPEAGRQGNCPRFGEQQFGSRQHVQLQLQLFTRFHRRCVD